MQRVLSSQLWRTIKAEAAKSSRRKIVIAYVTRDIIGLRRGDVLVTDASNAAVRSGETSAQLLSTLERKGVILYRCPNLHAKVILLDRVAIVGSGNMSGSSQSTLVEAAIMTDSPSTISAVASLIEQAVAKSKRLDRKAIDRLCLIKVVRRGGRPTGSAAERIKITPLGDQTWLMGLVEITKLKAAEQQLVDESNRDLARKTNQDEDSFTWIRSAGSGPFALKCKAGDQVIRIWRRSAKNKKPNVVHRSTPILLRKRAKHATFVFIEESQEEKSEMPWVNFKALLEKIGFRGAVGPTSQRILDPQLAEAISRNWNRA